MAGALKNDTKSPAEKRADERKKLDEDRDARDYQLSRAVDMVRGLSIYSGRGPAPENAKNGSKVEK